MVLVAVFKAFFART